MKKHGKNSLKTYLDKYIPDMEYEEKWIYIDGEKSIYKIRSNGDVVSTEYQGHKRKKDYVMKGGVDKDGYRLVALTHNHIKRTYKVHRLVAQYFIPNPFHKPEVNHKDGNTINNNVWNLEWVYTWENVHHAIETGLRYGTNSPEYIHLVCSLLESNQYSIHEISEISGVDANMVRKIRRGECYKSISNNYRIENFKYDDHINTTQYHHLPDDIIIGICDELMRNLLNISEISRKFGVSITTVNRVLNYETRPDITSKYSFNHYSRKGINQFIRDIERKMPNVQ